MQYTHNNLLVVVLYPPEALAATQQVAVLSKNIALARMAHSMITQAKAPKAPNTKSDFCRTKGYFQISVKVLQPRLFFLQTSFDRVQFPFQTSVHNDPFGGHYTIKVFQKNK